jgi:transposase-like protein
LTEHLGYAPHVRHESVSGNCRNGKDKKIVQMETGLFELEVSRDRNSLKYVPWKEPQAVTAALPAIYGAAPWSKPSTH